MVTPISGGGNIVDKIIQGIGKKEPGKGEEKTGEAADKKFGRDFIAGQANQLQGTANDSLKSQQAATNKQVDASNQTLAETGKIAQKQGKTEAPKSPAASATEEANKKAGLA